MSIIEFKNISLSLSNKTIFDKLNIKISEAENICISGPSGVGKSTLLKLISGFVIADSGEVYVNNNLLNPENISLIRKSIIWIPQNINLPVESGVELLNLLNIETNEDSVEKLIESLGLESNFLYKNFNEISGGQKQRVIIAVCLSLDKEIIIMDEPTSSLDEDSIIKLISTVNSLKGKTIISASHNKTWLDNSDKIIKL